MDFTLIVSFTLLVFSFADLTTEAVKVKSVKVFQIRMISKITTNATPALIITQKKKRKTFSPHKNRLTAMII